jgi:transcriptional regulator with XRE-family HTH domain
MDFKTWLNEQMYIRDWSQADLARASGLTRATISYYLGPKSKKPDEDALTKIAKAFKLPTELVFEKAGLLPPRTDLSPVDRIIMDLVKNLPENDKKAFQAMLEAWEENKKSTTAAPKTAK